MSGSSLGSCLGSSSSSQRGWSGHARGGSSLRLSPTGAAFPAAFSSVQCGRSSGSGGNRSLRRRQRVAPLAASLWPWETAAVDQQPPANSDVGVDSIIAVKGKGQERGVGEERGEGEGVTFPLKNGIGVAGIAVSLACGAAVVAFGIRHDWDFATFGDRLLALRQLDAGLFFQESVGKIQNMGPRGYLYFSALYVFAEILAIPAIPLTASAGYLFGIGGGTAVVLLSAAVAASISFLLGRTFLRSWVEGLLAENEKFQAIDKVIGREGFKIILLLRLSPVFPFALSNYLYGLTAVKFWPYFWGTLLGFAPGSLAYVYSGTVGKAIISGSSSQLPWYAYAAGAAVLAFFLKTIADVATAAVEEIDPSLGKED